MLNIKLTPQQIADRAYYQATHHSQAWNRKNLRACDRAIAAGDTQLSTRQLRDILALAIKLA